MRKDKGITLVALIITVVILLILAGIAINSLVGPNGLITRAIRERDEWNKSQEKEQIELSIVEYFKDKSVLLKTVEKRREEIAEKLEQEGYDVDIDDDKLIVTTKSGNIYEVTIDGRGDIKIECVGKGKLPPKAIVTLSLNPSTRNRFNPDRYSSKCNRRRNRNNNNKIITNRANHKLWRSKNNTNRELYSNRKWNIYCRSNNRRSEEQQQKQ